MSDLFIGLNKTEHDEFRRRVKTLIPQMKKSEIVNHFQKEGSPRRTIYDIINRMQHGETINDKEGRLTSLTPARNNLLKRLSIYHKRVSLRRLGRKLGVKNRLK